MKTVLIAGGTGLVGTHLSALLSHSGYRVIHLSRKENISAQYPAYEWDIEHKKIDENAFKQADYIINLAGSGIADKRWSEARKKEIIDSRVNSTLLFKHYLDNTFHKVKAYISASAIGFYGERGDEILIESAAVGQGFLAQSTQAWEKAISEIEKTNIRTVALRIGIVLSTKGGALEKMLIPFMFRTGVYFGNGKQWYSWIHIDDLCRLFQWSIENLQTQGIYNAVAPVPLSNSDLTKAIAEAKGGGYLQIPAPSFALRVAMGEMADVVLNSTRVSAQKLENQGFKFLYRDAVSALKDLFDRKL